MLKNRKTDTVLFVVLFTLYLKEDVVDGVVKDGVEGGKPLALMSEGDRERHERAKNGVEEEAHESGGPEGKENGGAGVETSADDVD